MYFIALTMVIKSYEEFSFISEFIDRTLISGDQIYVKVVNDLQQKGDFLNKLLNFDELPVNLTLGENHHAIQKFNSIWGLVVSEEQNSQIHNLHQALAEAFQISRYLLIMIGAICSGIYKLSDNEYYFFDSHSHGSDGMSSCDGKSVLVFNRNIDDLVLYLYNMYNSMHIDFGTQFEILPISIKTLYHSFPENDPSQKRFYRMDEKLLLGMNSASKEQNRKTYMREYMKKKRQNKEFKVQERIKETLGKKLRKQDDDEKRKKMKERHMPEN